MKKDSIILNNLNHVFLNNQILTYRKFLFVFLIIFQSFYTYSFASEINTLDGFYSNYEISRPFSAINYANKSLMYPTLKAPFVSRMDDKNVLNQLLISSILKTSYCTGESSSIVLNTTGIFNDGNSFRIEISDKNGIFNSPISMGTLSNFESGTHNLTFKIPTNIPIGNGYRIRAVASNPVTTSADNGFDIQINSIPSPVVSDTSVTICRGQTVRLSATCSQGNVRWYDASVNGNEIITTTILPGVTADYFAACEAGIGCASSRTKQHVIVKRINAIVPPFASSCLNSNVDLAAITDDVSLNYVWSGPSGFSSTLQNPTITNLTTTKEGVYSVVITNASSCVVNATTSVSIGQLLQNLNVVGNVSVCFNGTINLTASTSVGTGMNYSWAGPHSFTATGASISRSAFTTVNNATTYNNGTYTVVASNATGCSGTTSVDISVGNPPTPPLAASGSSCEGASYTIDWAITGANFQSYSWSGPNGFTTSSLAVCDLNLNCNHAIATIPNFLPENVGIYTIVANFNDNFGNSCTISASQNVTLKPKPDIVVSSTGTACLGDILRFFTTYSDATAGISSYAWTGPNNFTASTQNPIIYTNTLAATGVYKLTAVGLNGCVGTATVNAYVVESVPPLVEPTATVVLSNTITLTATGCSGTLLWYTTAGNESVTMPVSPIETTLYYAKCNNSGCVGGKSGDISVSVSPPIAISVKSGDWEDKYIWDIVRVPLAIDSVIIRPNHVVKVNSIANAKWLAWTGFGNLKFASSDSKLNLFGYRVSPPPTEIIIPPVIEANPVPLVEGVSVVFTATGTGTISWYKNGISLNFNGSTFTVNQPIRGDIYTAKRSVGVVMSESSNALIIVAAETVMPPVIDANPVALIENIPVTFTASGSGVISWYKNGTSLNITGSTYLVNQPIRGDVYTAKRSVNDVVSGASNPLTIVAANNSGVTITEPNKPAYYFSDGHPASYYNKIPDEPLKLPRIFTNQPHYDPVNDMVWLTNDKIKIGINLKRGGQLAWASLIDATSNLVYNGYDGGFQVTLDAYQRREKYTQGGEVAGSGNPGMVTSYNAIQGGDYLNHAVTLIDYHAVPNGYYIKVRPIHYPLTAKLSETYIEATYTIIGRSVKIDYRYTSFRTDGQWDGAGFDGAGAPSCFIVNTLNKYKTYRGNSPWSFSPLDGGTLPIINKGQYIASAEATEYWGMVYDDQHRNSGIGVYNATNGGSSTYFVFKQLEVFPENGPGTEFESGFTFFQPFVEFNNIANHRGNYVKDITSYLMIGSELEIRSEVYKISGHEGNIPRF